jgi:DNA-binding XRE family transcriptional regulator
MDNEKIGAKLRELRGERTQQDIANALGVTAVAVSKWERGESMPSDALKVQIAELYDTTVQDIFFTKD